MIYFSVFISAMLICLLVTPVLIRYASQLKLVDVPDERKIHVKLVPRVGGLGMIAGTIFSIAVWLQADQFILSFLASIIIIAVFGTWDDRVQLGYKIKFVGQFLATLIIIFYGGVKVNSLPFLYSGTIPDVIAIPFTIFALLGITNAINLSDGLDGLAGGSSLFSLGVIALLGYLFEDSEFVLICLAVIGATLGFLRFNTYPAVIFMGDTGSQFLGFSLGVLVINLCMQVSPVLSPAIAIIILGLPILDTFYVMTQRLMEGKSPFKPDKRHIHHKLLAAGLDHYEAVCVIYLVQSTLVICAYVFRFHNDFLILAAYLVSGLFLVFLIEQSGEKGIVKEQKKRISFVHQFLEKGTERRQLVRISFLLGSLGLLGYYLMIASKAVTIPLDVIIISSIVLIQSVVITLAKKEIYVQTLLRMELYLCATIIIYLSIYNASGLSEYSSVINGLYVFFLFIAILGFVLPQKDSKNITPLDYIIIFVIVLFSFLPEEQFTELSHFSHDIARLFMLFYLSEFLLTGLRKDLRLLKLVLNLILALILVKGIAF